MPGFSCPSSSKIEGVSAVVVRGGEIG